MDNRLARAAARAFLRQYGVSGVSAKGLEAALEDRGYTAVPFLAAGNSPAVSTVIETLHLEEMTAASKGFTYAGADYRLVFCRADLSEEERAIVLAHELGHIALDHLAHAPILGKDVTEEYEANEFARILLAAPAAKRRRRWLLPAAAALLLVLGLAIWRFPALRGGTAVTEPPARTLPEEPTGETSPDGAAYYGEYYVTATGFKFHTKDCGFITSEKRAEGVRRLTVDDYASGRYTPCSRCLPDFVPEPTE